MDKSNIMLISQRLIGGGAERVIVELANMLSESYNVILVAHDASQSYKNEYNYSYKIISLDIESSNSLFQRIKNFCTAIRKLKILKKKYNIRCSISMLPSPNFENVMSNVGEKSIISIRNKCSMQCPKGTYKYWISCLAGIKADKVITLSKSVQHDQQVYFKTPYQNIETIYNPCNTIKIRSRIWEKSNLTQQFKKIRSDFNFIAITAGRLVLQKGQWHLIKSFRKVVEEDEHVALVILGQGELQSELERLIINLGIQNNVFLLGFTENPYPLFAGSDLFVFSSLFEGFGNVLLEAMACGLPIVSCDCDAGPRELLAPGTEISQRTDGIEFAEFGVLTKPFDINADFEEDCFEEDLMGDAIIELKNNKVLRSRYRQKSLIRINDFAVDNIRAAWERVIKE